VLQEKTSIRNLGVGQLVAVVQHSDLSSDVERNSKVLVKVPQFDAVIETSAYVRMRLVPDFVG
jgi:hypothetical protein